MTESKATDDLLFKLVFSDERNKNALIHLLSSVVGFKISEVEIRKTELSPEFIGGKESRLDILATDQDGRLYNIELQKQNDPTMCERTLFYWSEVFYKQLDKGETYDCLRKTICINILDFRLFDDKKYWHTYHVREDETHELLTDLEEIHFLELSKMEKFKKDVPVTWWLEYLKDPHSPEVQKIGNFDPVIKEAVKMFDTIKADEKTQELIRLREKGERDFNSALKYSRMEGERREKIEMTKKLLLMGMALQDIQAITGLSISEIKSLQQKI